MIIIKMTMIMMVPMIITSYKRGYIMFSYILHSFRKINILNFLFFLSILELRTYIMKNLVSLGFSVVDRRPMPPKGPGR